MLTPLHKTILYAVAGVLFLVLVARLLWNWWSGRRLPALPPRAMAPVRPTPNSLSSSLSSETFRSAPVLRADDESLLLPANTPTVAGAQPVTPVWSEPAISPVHSAPPVTPTAVYRAYVPSVTSVPELMSVRADEVTTDESDYVFGPGITPAMSALLPESEERRKILSRQLQNAGYYAPHAWHNLSAIRWLGVALSLVVFGTLLLLAPVKAEPWLMAGLVVGPLLAWSLPSLYVRSQATERLGQIERGIPDMLDLLNMCVSQGMTVPVSLKRVGDELYSVYPALSKELQIVTEQARIGTLNQALDAFSRRVDVPEVHSFTSLLTQTERMGTSVSDALIEYSSNMRESLRQRADQKANTATFKLLFPTVFFLMPAVYLFLLGQPIIELSNFFGGRGREILTRGARSVQTRTLNR